MAHTIENTFARVNLDENAAGQGMFAMYVNRKDAETAVVEVMMTPAEAP